MPSRAGTRIVRDMDAETFAVVDENRHGARSAAQAAGLLRQ